MPVELAPPPPRFLARPMKCNLVYELRAKKVLLPGGAGGAGKAKRQTRPRQRFVHGKMNLALAARLKQWHVAAGFSQVARCTWQTTLAANFLLTLQQLQQSRCLRTRKNTPQFAVRSSQSASVRRICKQTHKVCGKSRIKFVSGGGERMGNQGGKAKVCRNKSIKCSTVQSSRRCGQNYLSGEKLVHYENCKL